MGGPTQGAILYAAWKIRTQVKSAVYQLLPWGHDQRLTFRGCHPAGGESVVGGALAAQAIVVEVLCYYVFVMILTDPVTLAS